jgi:hypothetical protein
LYTYTSLNRAVYSYKNSRQGSRSTLPLDPVPVRVRSTPNPRRTRGGVTVPKRAIRGDESRTEVVTIRLTKAERARLEQRASAAGLTVSAFAAQALAGGRITVETKPAALVLPLELIAEFKRIGNNVNQIAHALNSRKPVADAAVAREFLSFIRTFMRHEALKARATPAADEFWKSRGSARHDSPAP